MTSLSTIAPPKEHPGPSPLLRTVHEVEQILRRANQGDEGPLSLAEVKRRLGRKSIRHSTVRACVEELKRLHLVTEDPRHGVMWTYYPEPPSWRRKRWVKL
jgi:DNA-binding IclR family transcriptional regulator